MCGIYGYFKHQKIETDAIRQMTDALKHRGPDHTAYFEDERIQLGHNRLKIIDLSDASNQPFHSANGRYVMVYNGEVYNHRELAKELNLELRTQCDTEVILEAYVKLGADFIHKLNGMFAIAIYDCEKGTLNLWRDRMGIKPLCYYWDGEIFAFASELKALLTLPLPRVMDTSALNDFLFLEYIPNPKTIFNHFYKLKNGHCLTVEDGKLSSSCYYDVLSFAGNQIDCDEVEAIDEFEKLFQSSLGYRLIADVPIGAFLSGGIDSSSICAAARKGSRPLKTFTIGFDDKRYDESAYAKKVAEKLGTDHHTYALQPNDLLKNKEVLFHQYDEPFAVGSVFPTYEVSRLARENVTVALSGDGSDELFMGYGHYAWHDRLHSLNGASGKMMRNMASTMLSKLSSRYARVGKLIQYDTLEKDWPHVWSQDQYMFTEAEVSDLTGTTYRHETLRESWQRITESTTDPYQRISLFDLKHYLTDDLLYKVDIASMANSMEVRLPFLDHRLVEFAIQLPSSLKYQKNQQKYLLRSYLSKHLSSDLINRAKWGFGAPVDQWMKHDLSPMVNELLNKDALLASNVFEPDLVNKLKKRVLAGSQFEFKRLWALVIFQSWFMEYGTAR